MEHFGLPAHHDGQGALLGANVPSTYGRVEHFHALCCQLLRDAHGGMGRNGAHVDDDHAWTRAVNDAIGAKDDLLHIGRIAHNGDNHVRRARDLSGGIGPSGSLGHQGIRLGGGAVPHGERVARAQHVHGHRLPHDAQANETNTGHLCHGETSK